ncbi:MAG: hypothetical protein LBU06_08125, partial [Desulfovibrio sp.]|nr:hypothetical protein [Desulfovibrio sp.]
SAKTDVIMAATKSAKISGHYLVDSGLPALLTFCADARITTLRVRKPRSALYIKPRANPFECGETRPLRRFTAAVNASRAFAAG